MESDNTEAISFYNKIIGGIRNLRHANFIINVTHLHKSLTHGRHSAEMRGKMFYNILIMLAKYKEFEIPEVSSMSNIHTIFHEEIMGLGTEEYMKLMSFYTKFPNVLSKLMMVSPFLGNLHLLENFNSPLVTYVKLSCLRLEYNKKIDKELAKCIETNPLIVSEYSKYTRYPDKIYSFLDDIGTCENDAYADDVAFVVENAINFSEDMRKIYIYIQQMFKRRYRLTLFHSSSQIDPRVYVNTFYDCIYLNPQFNNHFAKNVINRRYRYVFYTNNNIWSMFLANAQLGLTQFYIATKEPSQLPNIAECIEYLGITEISVNAPKCEKTAEITDKIILCPLTVDEVMTYKSDVENMDAENTIVQLFCIDGPYEMYRFAPIAHSSKKNYYVFGEDVDDYYNLMQIADIVVCASYSVFVDALYLGKNVSVLPKSSAEELITKYPELKKLCAKPMNIEKIKEKIDFCNAIVTSFFEDFSKTHAIEDRTGTGTETEQHVEAPHDQMHILPDQKNGEEFLSV